MTAPSQRRVTWAEVAEWLPDGEAEVAFDRDVLATGLDASAFPLFLRRCATGETVPLDGLIWGSTWPFELWAIDEEAPLAAHRHDVRSVDLSFPEAEPAGPCRCRVWRGPARGWCAPDDERRAMAKRGIAFYEVVGGRARYLKDA